MAFRFLLNANFVYKVAYDMAISASKIKTELCKCVRACIMNWMFSALHSNQSLGFLKTLNEMLPSGCKNEASYSSKPCQGKYEKHF